MKTHVAVVIGISLVLLYYHLDCLGQENNEPPTGRRALFDDPAQWGYNTHAYQVEVVNLLVAEANRVATQLKLPERMPITRSNLVSVHVHPPGMGEAAPMLVGALGYISTSNYIYHVNHNRKFSDLIQRNLEKEWVDERKTYMWPVDRVDTNKALQIAGQMLTDAGVDLQALNRDCSVRVAFGRYGDKFVPDYWVTWGKPGKLIAFVEFLQPTFIIRQLHVMEGEYILRKPIEIQNLESLLNPPGKLDSRDTNQIPAWRRVEERLNGMHSPRDISPAK